MGTQKIFFFFFLNACLSISAVIFYKQFLVYTMHIGGSTFLYNL